MREERNVKLFRDLDYLLIVSHQIITEEGKERFSSF